MRGAIRSIIAMQQNGVFGTTMHPYQINTNWIFLAGQSAGAITVLNVAYYDQTMLNTLNRYSLTKSIVDALGPIDADYYYGGTGIEYTSKIRGVLDQWGSVAVPGNYYADSVNAKDFFTRRIPVIAFHGQQDPVVRFYVFPANFAQTDTRMPGFGNTYVSETSCLLTGTNLFKTDNKILNNPDFATFGSYSFFHHILQPLDIPSELYIDCQAKHGLDKCDCDPLDYNNDNVHHINCAIFCNFQSDYGTGYTSQTAVTEYIVERAVVFFKNIMTNNDLIHSNAQRRQDNPSTVKVFVECRNTYSKCGTTENGTGGCSNDDYCH